MKTVYAILSFSTSDDSAPKVECVCSTREAAMAEAAARRANITRLAKIMDAIDIALDTFVTTVPSGKYSVPMPTAPTQNTAANAVEYSRAMIAWCAAHNTYKKLYYKFMQNEHQAVEEYLVAVAKANGASEADMVILGVIDGAACAFDRNIFFTYSEVNSLEAE